MAGLPAVAQTKTTFVRLGNGVPGVLYEPVTAGAKAQIGIFVMHSGGDYLQFSACTELSKRGYRVLCANTTVNKSGFTDDTSSERVTLDAKLGVAWLKKYPGIRKVVLFGHSGGGVLMSTYQNIAENGVKVCQGPEKIYKCPDTLAGLPPADGVMLVDSNYGLPAMLLFSIDPATTGSDNGMERNAALDLFNPANGFKASGPAYSDDFVKRWLGAEGKRNNQLIQTALDRLKLIEAGKGRYKDDEPFVIPAASFKGSNNQMFSQDVHLLAHTRKAWPLLKADGTEATQIVPTVRVPENLTSVADSYQQGAMTTTVRKFLSTFAVRTTEDYGYDADTIRGIDWNSSYNNPEGSVEGIHVPLLVMGMTGHWEYLSSEMIYEHAKSADKTIAFVEGATHGYTPCTKCERTPGQFGDTIKRIYDYVDGWLSKPGRFQ
jgi:hypothetical protein